MFLLALKILAGLIILFSLALTGFLIYHLIIRPPKAPVDSSNRFNKPRLLWFALTRPEKFYNLYPDLVTNKLKDRVKLLKDVILHEDKFVKEFPWLRNDEWENLIWVTRFHPYLDED